MCTLLSKYQIILSMDVCMILNASMTTVVNEFIERTKHKTIPRGSLLTSWHAELAGCCVGGVDLGLPAVTSATFGRL